MATARSGDDGPALEVIGLHKAYGAVEALSGVSFDVDDGAIVALLGPSGCGKTTVLRIVAGLETADAGTVRWRGRSVDGLPAHERGFGLMFQDDLLFPHLNVADNVAFGLRMAGEPPEARGRRTAEVLELVGLSGFEDRDVATLSGGEQQRVALARALAPRPKLLMLDEPMGSLDRALRERLLAELKRLLTAMGQTAVVVTHDQDEAFALSESIVVMDEGRVLARGTPAALYARPPSARAARFLGLDNILAAAVEAAAGGRRVRTPLGLLPLADGTAAPAGASQFDVLLRPDAARLAPVAPSPSEGGSDGAAPGTWSLTGHVVDLSFRGLETRVRLRVGATTITVSVPPGGWVPGADEAVVAVFDARRAVVPLVGPDA